MGDITKSLRSAISTGKVLIGARQTIDAVKSGKAKMVVLAQNCPNSIRSQIAGVAVLKYPGQGVDLGIACGKPFSINTLAVIEAGESEILAFRSE